MSDLTEGAVRGGLYAQCLTLQRGPSEGVCMPNVRPYRGGRHRGSVCPMSDLTEGAVRGGLYAQCLTSQKHRGGSQNGLFAQCLTLQRGPSEGVCMPNVRPYRGGRQRGSVIGGLSAQCLTLQRRPSEGVCMPNVRPYRGSRQSVSVWPISDLTEGAVRVCL